MNQTGERTTAQKIALYTSLFKGRTDVYGTYDPKTGRAGQVKQPVTKQVVISHLKGERPYGIYLLLDDRIHALAVDFDQEAPEIAQAFIAAAGRYGLSAYIERSKCKGYHSYLFFEENGVLAAPARLIVRRMLDDISQPRTEIFPKQDRLDKKTPYGNYINAPLFGALVPQGRTVFLDPANGLAPYADQWSFLEQIKRISAAQIEQIIDQYDLIPPAHEASGGQASAPSSPASSSSPSSPSSSSEGSNGHSVFGLPPCAQRMLREGVQANQRVSCFRLAIGLKKAGIPYDLALATLKAWSRKNKPEAGKGVITEREVVAQTAWAYDRDYKGCGCEEPAIALFCDHQCPLIKAGKNPPPKVAQQNSEGAAHG